MGSLENPQAWPPYDRLKDCSQGFCSLYCPQWCYIIFPPPPPLFPDDQDSGTNFSPLVIAIIGILASAFLLVTYYTVISKYCSSSSSSRRRGENDTSEESIENQTLANQETWQAPTSGLDEALIKTITVCKYKKGDGFVDGTDCSVCLSEFEEDESLRLLPKCSHAFHLSCIDTWLKSHSNCPLCRANVVPSPTSPCPLPLPPSVQQVPSSSQAESDVVVLTVDDLERRNEEDDAPQNDLVPKTPNVENLEAIIEIREERVQAVRRAVSMDDSCQDRVSIADILCSSEDDDSPMDDQQCHFGEGSSSRRRNEEHNKYNDRSRALHSVASPVPMKRSFSSGRFSFTRQGRGKNVILPM